MNKLLFSFLLCSCAQMCSAQKQQQNQAVIDKLIQSDTYARLVKNVKTSNAAPNNVTQMTQANVRAMNTSTQGPITANINDIATACKQISASSGAESRANTYGSLTTWLASPPKFTWTAGAIEQPSAAAMSLLMLQNDMKHANTGEKLGPQIEELMTRSRQYIRYSWNNGKQSSYFQNLGTDEFEETQRLANVGYRIFALASIAMVTNDNNAMDTLSMIVKNQFLYDYNKSGYFPATIKSDGIIDQHNLGGSQVYNIGYGGDFINDMIRYGNWFRNTPYALSDKEFNTLADLMTDGTQWMFYKNHPAFNIMGRHNALIVNGSASPAYMDQRGNINYLSALIQNKNTDSYKKLMSLKNRLNDFGSYNMDSSKYFWNSDLLIQSNPDYFACIKMLSNKTGSTETGDRNNREGINNYYMGEGSTIMFHTGREYDNARAVWNWRAIPGTTVKQKNGALPLIAYGQFSESNNNIAGGVSDGKTSIGGFYLDRKNNYTQVNAQKAYFAFPKFLLCLGNGVNDNAPDGDNIVTTLNQSERLTPIVYAANGKQPMTVGTDQKVNTTLTLSSPSWFWQDNTGYIIIPSGEGKTVVNLIGEQRQNNWNNIDKRNPSQVQNVNIFQLGIVHGNQGKWNCQEYIYVVVPNVTADQMGAQFTALSSGLKIVNTKDQQSVAYQDYFCTLMLDSRKAENFAFGNNQYKLASTARTAVIIKKKGNQLRIDANKMDNGDNSAANVTIANSNGKKQSLTIPAPAPQSGWLPAGKVLMF
ncbi:hypothetical protein DCC81_01150 [Chitinophaga parva]|uniref:Polysaccharide lyase family 8 central domain-containing protein n=1 Tax=Chitinophaga parva TaxID=2169414 RepID=A0A2T7BKE9_9BACT|nr:polysaccharide lyase family 8 super-sandwich domain-containing protein [Chitinophaga parva]PUZ28119.1 hypothetical protein DCC81_01150 [Chitinophaga parva]